MKKIQTFELIRGFFESTQVKELDQEGIKHLYLLSDVLNKSKPSFADEHLDFVLHHIDTVKDTLDCLVSKHILLDDMDKEYPLTINAVHSGYPTITDLFYLRDNKNKAEAALEKLPERELIIENARDFIYAGKLPIQQQKLLMKTEYLRLLEKTDLFGEFSVSQPRKGKGEPDQRYYSIEWYGLDPNTQVPVFYKMYFTQDTCVAALEDKECPKLNTFMYTSMHISQSPLTLAYSINNTIEEICPRVINRVQLGPFFSAYTDNHEHISALFEGVENPYLLEVKIDSAIVTSSRMMKSSKFFKRIMGRFWEKAIYVPIESTHHIMPFRLQQELLDHSSTKTIGGDKTFGITDEGGLNECYKR